MNKTGIVGIDKSSAEIVKHPRTAAAMPRPIVERHDNVESVATEDFELMRSNDIVAKAGPDAHSPG